MTASNVADAQEVCFTASEHPTVPVIENAPPPADDHQQGYAYYPATSIASMRLDALLASRSTAPKYYWQWSNHGPRRVEKGNIAPGLISQQKRAAIDFSSSASADACTLAQTSAVLGDMGDASAYAKRNRLELRSAAPQAGQTQDVCVLPSQTLSPGMGILLDYEVQDDRAPAESEAFLTQYAALVHAAHRKVILYTNPLDAPGQSRTGLDASNLVDVAGAFDEITILLWGRNREGDIASSYRAQRALLPGVPASKIVDVFELNNTTLADSVTMHRILAAEPPAALMFWRDNVAQGGPCSTPVNQKIACSAFGRCPGGG